MMYPTRLEEGYILRNMLEGEKETDGASQGDFRQMSLFEDGYLRKEGVG